MSIDSESIVPLSTPAVSGDAVVFSFDGRIEARDAASGEFLWSDARSPSPRFLSVRDGVFYGAGGTTAFAATDAGDEDWAVPLPFAATGRPSDVDDDTYYVPLEAGRIIALDRSSGGERWRRELMDDSAQDAALRGVTAANGRVYVAVEQLLPDSRRLGYVYALDPENGETVWRFIAPRRSTVRSTVIDAPAVAGELLLASDLFANAVIALDATTGDSLWTWLGPTGWTGPRASPVIRGEVAYVGSGDTHVYALSLANGAVLWSRRLDSSVHEVAICDDRLLAHRDQLELLDLDGHPLDVIVSGYDYVRTDLAVDDDRAFFVTNEALMAIRCS